MTEYDFSPEAIEAHIRKQYQIANWVDNTNRQPLRNPFTPATPAVQALALKDRYPDDDYDDAKRHRRRETKDHRDRYGDRDRADRQSTRDRERERDRDKDRDGTSSKHRPSMSSSSRPNTKRNRSASQSATPARPEPTRNYSVPHPLQLPPHNYLPNSQQSSPTYVTPPYSYPPKMTSPRDSRDSSRSSATVPQSSSTSYFPQQVPHSAPIPRPSRMQTMPPNYGYPMDSKYPYNTPQQGGFQNGFSSYPGKQQFDVANAPQYPHSMYQTKPPPLLKRIFMGLTGGNKHAQPKVPRRKRSSSF